MTWTLLFMTSPVLFVTSLAYPGGVPDLACESMFPAGHDSPVSQDVSPYFIQMPTSTYRPGETVKLNIFSRRGQYFTGIYVQARRVGCHVNGTEVVGVFTAIDPLLRTRHCFGHVHTAVSHTSNVKKTGVSIYWTAPVVSSGHVVIKATVVKTKDLFWTDVDSAPLIDLRETDTPFCVSHTHKAGYSFDHSQPGYQAKRSHLATSHHWPANGTTSTAVFLLTRPSLTSLGILYWLCLSLQ